jgi:capsule polysaccharide export protein KpsE/RkpR
LKDFTPTGAASRLGGGQGSVNYLAILKSRRASEALIREYDLINVYDISNNSMEKAIKALEGNLNIEVSPDGTILLEVYDRDSVRAAAMANSLVRILNEVAIDLGTREARSNRMFLEKRVDESKAELAGAEQRLKEYQEKQGVVILNEQAKETAQAAGELYAKRMELDIKMAIMEKTSGEGNPAYDQYKLEKSEIDRRLAKFPEMGLQSYRLFRDILVQQKILEFLIPMYEQARLEEQKDVPVVVVLDRAVPAERKAKPKRLLIMGASTLSALFLAMLYVIGKTRFDLYRTEHPDRYELLRSAFRSRQRS